MKDTPRPLKVFLDTSVLLSGLNSPFGASNFILSLFKLKKIIVVISPDVINEAEEAIKVYKIISTEDAPILAAAIKAHADCLITLDKRFQKVAAEKVKFEILLPSEFLQKYKKAIIDTDRS